MRRALEFVQRHAAGRPQGDGRSLLQKLLQTGQTNYALAARTRPRQGPRGPLPRRGAQAARAHGLGNCNGARRDAWKHLLSAAFGTLEDGPLNLDLARCYGQGAATHAPTPLRGCSRPRRPGDPSLQPSSGSRGFFRRGIEGRCRGRVGDSAPRPVPSRRARCRSARCWSVLHQRALRVRDRRHARRDGARSLRQRVLRAGHLRRGRTDPLVNRCRCACGTTAAPRDRAVRRRRTCCQAARSRFKQGSTTPRRRDAAPTIPIT